jgi:AMP nucleosidase
MANRFYREHVDQHLRIGVRAVELLCREHLGRLHSRKLRNSVEVTYR